MKTKKDGTLNRRFYPNHVRKKMKKEPYAMKYEREEMLGIKEKPKALKESIPRYTEKPLWKCEECKSTKKSSYKKLCHRCYENKWKKTPKSMKSQRKYIKKYELLNKAKVVARRLTRQQNEKTKICFDCKKQGKTEFHHLSYEPNIFIELCRGCHNERHST